MSKCLLGLGGRLEGKRLVKWDGDRVWKGRTASPKHPTTNSKFISSLTFYIQYILWN